MEAFLVGMFGSRPIEIIAVCLGIVNITLLVRRSIWNYPFGIMMVTLYAFIFFEAKLYSDMLLQGFFFTLQAYGWWFWLQGMPPEGGIRVQTLNNRARAIYGLASVVGVATLGSVMMRYTDASLPYWDATTTVLSMAAQLMLARKCLENWVLWIVVDVLAIGIYYVKGLYPTMVLYTIFLVIASIGYWNWRKTWREQQAA